MRNTLNIRRFRLRHAVALTAICSAVLVLPAASLAGSNHQARLTPYTARAKSPCRFYQTVQALINDVSNVPADSLTLDECGVALAAVCVAEQYNKQHSTNVAFYRSQNFYRSCERAYLFLKSGYLQRKIGNACGFVTWAFPIILPFAAPDFVVAKIIAVGVGLAPKFAGC